MRVLYLDASSVVKLAVVERETEALRKFVGASGAKASSEILVTESMRAVKRRLAATGQDDGPALSALAAVIAAVNLWPVDRRLLARAGQLEPSTLGTLDAIHIATAVSLPHMPASFVSYDERQLAAARGAGLATVSPGWDVF